VIAAFAQVAQFVVSTSLLAPFKRIGAFFADILVVEVELHVFDVLIFLAVHFDIYVTSFVEVLVVLRIFKPGVPVAGVVITSYTDVIVDVVTATAFVDDLAFDLIIARGQIAQVVVSAGTLAPLEGIG